MKIKILGSASGVPTKKRFCESIAVSINRSVYLIDAGEPCSALLLRAGICSHNVKAVFISHMDPDHSSGIFMLIQKMALTGRKSPLKLFIPHDAVDGLTHYFRTVYPLPEHSRFRCEVLPLKEKFTYDDENLTLTVYPNRHLKDRFGENDHGLTSESYSFLMKSEGRIIIYSGDVAKPEDLEPLLKNKIDLLISEMAHFKPEELFHYLSKKNIDKIILTHIHPDLDNSETELVGLGNKYLGRKRTLVAYDGFEMKMLPKV
jgi:ribonuclease BN (tRNA processing enzyme)